jgi:hypothetical protein
MFQCRGATSCILVQTGFEKPKKNSLIPYTPWCYFFRVWKGATVVAI